MLSEQDELKFIAPTTSGAMLTPTTKNHNQPTTPSEPVECWKIEAKEKSA